MSMNDFIDRLDKDLPVSNSLPLDEEVKSSLRLTYEAQVRVIQQQTGGLEKIRQKLGLSQRKMAQLLMVDPSAWTRWTKSVGGEGAPPSVWRSLQWYLTLQDKIPGLNHQYFLSFQSNKALESKTDELKLKQEMILTTLRQRNSELENSFNHLNNRMESLEKNNKVLKLGFGGVTIAAVILLIEVAILLKK